MAQAFEEIAMNRRDFGALVAASLAVPATAARAGEGPQESRAAFAPIHDRRRPVVGMLLYPGLTLMDLLGPQTVLSTSSIVHLVWKTKDPIETETGIGVRPDTTFDECPKDLDVLFVGGGPGQLAVMKDPECLRFLADRGARAKYVTSVCSGSLVLGAAGLLRGYEAACHWAARDALPLFGAIPVARRVVVDRNRITGGGVTAGIDFGLVLLAEMLGEEVAKMTQLAMEYDPQPPFRAGSPEEAGPEITRKVRDWIGPLGDGLRRVSEEAGRSLPK
jgi:cyclohexyl-isocyanide hydratase